MSPTGPSAPKPDLPLRPQEVLAASASLEQTLGAFADPEEIAGEARSLVSAAVAAGASTWDSEERNELRQTISRWVGVLHRTGERIELPDLAPFEGHLPSLERMDAKTVLAKAREGKPIIAARIEGCDLRELDAIPRVLIADCVLSGCDLGEIELPSARLLHTTFAGCNFTGAKVPNLVATSSIFNGGSLDGVKAAGGTLCGTRFDGVHMREGDFTEASFASTTFREVKAEGAGLAGAFFDLATLDSMRLEGAALAGAIFTGASVRKLSFRDADLTLSIFAGADVRGSTFVGAHLEGAFFRTAVDVALAEFDSDAPLHAEFSQADAADLQRRAAARAA